MLLKICTIPMLILVPLIALGQTVTAFKTGEQTTGMTKQCFYQSMGNSYVKTISSVALCPLSIQVGLPGSDSNPYQPPPAQQQQQLNAYPQQQRVVSTVIAFKIGERRTGMTKQCFYDALGNEYVKTISSVALCPLSIKVRSGGY